MKAKETCVEVLEERAGPRAYRIRKDFYKTFLSLFPAEASPVDAVSILHLQGLGKEVWAGIDAEAYVNHERSAWAG